MRAWVQWSCPADTTLSGPPQPLPLTTSCYPVNNGWLTWGGEDVCSSFMAQSSTDSYSLLFNQLWVALIMAATIKRHFSDEVCESLGTKMNLEGHLVLYPFSKIIVGSSH